MADTATNDGLLAYIFLRDTDTLGPFINTGVMTLKPYHEWGDSYDPATGETGRVTGERYNPDTDTFEPVCTVGTPVFNGRLSGLWDCVERAYPTETADMYRAMRAAGFNAESLLRMIGGYKNQWCEALYNADAMGYVNTGRFDMAYGDKHEVMRAFLTTRFRYLDSKYGANTSTPLELRLWGTGRGVALRYYCPLYASMNWGSKGILTARQIHPGEPSFFPSNGDTFSQTTFTVYNADLLTEITTYSEDMDGHRTEYGLQDLATEIEVRSGADKCRRLKNVDLDFASKGTVSTQMKDEVLKFASASVAMRRMVVTNCPNVTGSAQFASQVIEEIDFRGTGVSGVSVPETDTLKTLRLGPSMASLTLKNLTGLSTLTAEGTGKLQSMEIENCPAASAGMMKILTEALDGETLRRVRITNVEWKNLEAKYLERLADLGAELTGRIALKEGERMTFALKQKCLAAWGDIDSAGNALRIEYAVSPLSVVRISGAGYWGETGDHQLKAVSENPNANDFRSVEWSMEENPYAEIDTLAGRVTVRRVGTEEEAPTAMVTVRVTKLDGTVVSRSIKVGFYERMPQIGDAIHADGTVSDIVDEGKTIIAWVSYINTDDPAHGIAVAAQSIGTGAYGNDNAANVSLTDDPSYDTATIPAIPITNMGYNSANMIPPRISTNPVEWEYLTYTNTRRFGFTVLQADILGHSAGDLIPIGMMETLFGIRHRNKILRDSGIDLPIPEEVQSDKSVLNVFKVLLTNANAKPGNGYRYYFPAFSLAYAYEPAVKDGEELKDEFKARRWFLPTPGDMAIVAYHYSRTEGVDACFQAAKQRGFSLDNDFYMTTGQQGSAWCLHVNPTTGASSGQWNGSYMKTFVRKVVPFVAF